LKAEHGANSRDHWSLQEELKAVHNEYLSHKAEFNDEAKLFTQLQAAHGEKSKEHWTLAEELQALHTEHHEHKKLSAQEIAKYSTEYQEEAKMFERIKEEHGAKTKDHWTVTQELQALHTEFAAHKQELEAHKKKASPENLKVTIISARGLRKADLIGKSDPYVICHQATHGEVKTPVIDNNQDPVWNCGPKPVVYQTPLEFHVYDQDDMNGDDFLGMAVLQRDQFRLQGFEGELPLKNKDGGPGEGFIKIKVEHG